MWLCFQLPVFPKLVLRDAHESQVSMSFLRPHGKCYAPYPLLESPGHTSRLEAREVWQ